jgi:hypothetical protein
LIETASFFPASGDFQNKGLGFTAEKTEFLNQSLLASLLLWFSVIKVELHFQKPVLFQDFRFLPALIVT